LSTFPDTLNASSVEQARLRCLLASLHDGCFSDWSPIKIVYRHTENGWKNAPQTIYSFSAARREQMPLASAPRTKISGIPNPWSIFILPKFGRWSRCQSIYSVMGEVFLEHQCSFLTNALHPKPW